MTDQEKIIKCALDQVGYEEPNHDNRTKYGEQMDTIYSGFFNGKKNGYDWCATFSCWLFCHCFGISKALEMLHMPPGNMAAVVKYFYGYLNKAGRTGSTPKKGAVIFFQNSKGLSHVGVVVDFDSEYVTTVEGNAGSGSYFVAKNRYRRTVTYIYGYGYPEYAAEPEREYKRGEIYTITCKEPLRLRMEPDTGSEILLDLHKGDHVHCLKVVKKDCKTWLRVDGYCCAEENDQVYIE